MNISIYVELCRNVFYIVVVAGDMRQIPEITGLPFSLSHDIHEISSNLKVRYSFWFTWNLYIPRVSNFVFTHFKWSVYSEHQTMTFSSLSFSKIRKMKLVSKRNFIWLWFFMSINFIIVKIKYFVISNAKHIPWWYKTSFSSWIQHMRYWNEKNNMSLLSNPHLFFGIYADFMNLIELWYPQKEYNINGNKEK